MVPALFHVSSEYAVRSPYSHCWSLLCGIFLFGFFGSFGWVLFYLFVFYSEAGFLLVKCKSSRTDSLFQSLKHFSISSRIKAQGFLGDWYDYMSFLLCLYELFVDWICLFSAPTTTSACCFWAEQSHSEPWHFLKTLHEFSQICPESMFSLFLGLFKTFLYPL